VIVFWNNLLVNWVSLFDCLIWCSKSFVCLFVWCGVSQAATTCEQRHLGYCSKPIFLVRQKMIFEKHFAAIARGCTWTQNSTWDTWCSQQAQLFWYRPETDTESKNPSNFQVNTKTTETSNLKPKLLWNGFLVWFIPKTYTVLSRKKRSNKGKWELARS
jgi:hypothetical protein